MANTIAILGATGKTGRGIVQHILAKEDWNLRIYVRSRSKLLDLFPDLLASSRVFIFEGALQNTENMTNCLDGAQRIVFTLGENENIPGVSVIEDGVKSVLAALARLRTASREWHSPRIVFLSSSTWNPRFAAARPVLIHWLIKNAFIYPYADLVRGQNRLLDNPDLVNVLLVQPGGLVEDKPSGHEISVESVRLATTYADLASAFVDLACTRDYDAVHAVGVSSKGGDNGLRYGPTLGGKIIKGICATYIPGFWTAYWFVNRLLSASAFRNEA